ncbi:MAG: hypothetical protein KDE31_05285, partial [Caldilineaceae bacterium]|nr:hypothetical protein [Caldilineaceae bacterium]
ESVVDLNPTGFTESRGMALAENRQVGQGRSPTATGNLFHALLWQGSANSYVDLNPTGFNASIANGIWGNYQVGNGLTTSLQTHALLWNGTAGSFVDLNPPEYSSSIAYDVWAENQVGKGSGTATGGMDHALLWHGTAASVVDLHPFLSGLSITMTRSEARAVDAQGTITGTAFDASGTRYAVLWTPIIEAGAGDFNGDNKVDGRDFLSWQRGSSPESYSSVDLGAWSANYGREAWQVVGVPVPEPSGALITVMLGMLTVCSHASRSRCVYARNP